MFGSLERFSETSVNFIENTKRFLEGMSFGKHLSFV